MRYLVTDLFDLLTKYLRRVRFDNDLCLKVGSGAIAKIFMVLAGKTIGASMNTSAIAVDGISPTAFPS